MSSADAASVFAAAGLRVFERGWLSSNSVLFASAGADETVLVDTGYWSHQDQTLALVKAALGGRALARVVNSHLHSDHCGGNALLQAHYGCRIDVPAGERRWVDDWDDAGLGYADAGQHCPRFRCHGALRDGDEIELGGRPWMVVASPGHDPESVVFFQAKLGILISADALWENGFGVIFPELDGEQGFVDAQSTLERIAGLGARWIIPGHGPPFSDRGDAVQRALRKLEGFAADPRKHARHAAKVLLKFHMLEVQRERKEQLHQWCAATPLLVRMHARHFVDAPLLGWIDGILTVLANGAALQLRGDEVANL